MEYSKLRNIIFVMTISLIGYACNDTSTGIENGQGTAVVKGRVENTGPEAEQKAKNKKIEGAVVTAAYISSSGVLKTVEGAETQTNAEGRFSLQVSSEAVADHAGKIVIVAEKEGDRAKTFITSKIESGATIKVQPITFESSAETEIYQELVASGDASLVTKADIEAVVYSDVAADIAGQADYAAEVASGIAAYAEAKAHYYSEQGIEVTEEQMARIKQQEIDAQVELESQLYAAASAEDRKAAYKSFLQTMAHIETEAGIKAAAVAKSSEVAAHILLDKCSGLSAEAQAEIRQLTAFAVSVTMETAVKAQLKAAGASETAINNAAEAAVALRADLEALSEASKEGIAHAFGRFNSEMEMIVEHEFEVDGSLFAEVNSRINQEGGAKASLKSALEGTLELSGVIDVYTDFYSTVRSAADSTFETAGDAELKAYTELLILINFTY